MKFNSLISKLILSTLVLLFHFTAIAETLKPIELKNQFDEATPLTKETKWVLFSKDKALSDVINKQLETMKLTDIAAAKGYYVADISKMPSLVTSMFALPKMKKYPFKVMLDRDGVETKSWPQKEGHVTLMKLNELNITETLYLKSEDEIKKALTDLTTAPAPAT